MNAIVLRDLVHGWTETGELPEAAASEVVEHLAPVIGRLGWSSQARALAAYLSGDGRGLLVEGPHEGGRAAVRRHRWELNPSVAWSLGEEMSAWEGRSVAELAGDVVGRLAGTPMTVPPPPDWARMRVEAALQMMFAPHLRHAGRGRLVDALARQCEGLGSLAVIDAVGRALCGPNHTDALARGVPLDPKMLPNLDGPGVSSRAKADPLGLASLEAAWEQLGAANLPPGEARRLFAQLRPDVERIDPAEVGPIVKRHLAVRADFVRRGPIPIRQPHPRPASAY